MNDNAGDIKTGVGLARSALFQHFVDARTNLIYDFRDPDRDRNLPTPEEIRKEIPNVAGWATGFEDTAIAGGALLNGLAQGYTRTRDPELAEQARLIWNGLRLLGTASPCRGFVCRGVLPSDRQSHYPNSSADQYTLYCAGLYRYFNSDLATTEDRKVIADIAVGICEFVMGANMTIPREDGKPGLVGDVGWDEIVNGANVRIAGPGVLQYLALAAATTGAAHWRSEYERARDACNRLPLRRLAVKWNPDTLKIYCVYILMQAAYLFRMLYDYEEESEAKDIYRQTLGRIAGYSVSLLNRYNPAPVGFGFWPMPSFDWRKDHRFFHEVNPKMPCDGSHRSVGTWLEGRPGLKCELKYIREPMECLSALMLSEEKTLIQQYAAQAKHMLVALPVDQMKNSGSFYLVETVFRRGIEIGVW